MLVAVATVAAWCVVVVSGLGEPIYRLPKTVLPTQYKLTIQTSSHGNFFNGQVIIDVDVKADTNNITLHSKDLIILRVTLVEAKGIDEIPSTFSLEPKREVILIKSSRTLQSAGKYSIEILFLGNLTTMKENPSLGYIRVATGPSYSNWMTTTLFQMVGARRTFPCWDEPQYKARFLVALTHLTTHKALSNMPLNRSLQSEEYGDDWVIDQFENSPMMSSYLVTFQLLQWGYIDNKTDGGKPLRLYADPKDLPFADDHLDFARKALVWLQNYTGVKEPMPKIDLVAVPGFVGAIENWGDISFGPEHLMHNTSNQPLDIEMSVIAHELAHSWFGNLVTPLWWDSLWLSEGAATFFSVLAVEELIPGVSLLRSKILESQTLTYYNSCLEQTETPLSKPFNYMEDFIEMPEHVYYHGFSIFYMLYQSLGPEHFKAGVHRYISGLLYNNTTPRKFYDALNYNYNGTDLYELMEEWTYQGGFPVVTVTRSEGQLTLKQEHFILDVPKAKPKIEREDKKWWVPITITTQSGKDFYETKPTFWFKENQTIRDPAKSNEWIILNNMASGLYIVEYDKTTLEMIKKSLATPNHDGIPETMREKLYFDFNLLMLKGKYELVEIWEMHELLANETAEGPWIIVMESLSIAKARNFRASAFEILKRQLESLLEKKREQHFLQSNIGRNACILGFLKCNTSSSKLFHQRTIQSHPEEVNPLRRWSLKGRIQRV